MKIYDISLSLSPTTTRWATAQPFELIERKRTQRGDTNNSSSVNTSVHAGTHVDAPFHFVPNGATIESLPLELFIGPARVCAVDGASQIGASEVASLKLLQKRPCSKHGIHNFCKKPIMIRRSFHFPKMERRL